MGGSWRMLEPDNVVLTLNVLNFTNTWPNRVSVSFSVANSLLIHL